MESISVEVINKIEEMAVAAHEEFETHEINGDLYVNKELHKVKPEPCREVGLSSLCGLVDFAKTTIKTSKELFAMPLIIRTSYDTIKLQSSLDKNMDRNSIAETRPILPRINFDTWMSMEDFIIQLQTCFVDTTTKSNLIEIVSQMTEETSVSRKDDGVGQEIVVKKCTGLKEGITFNPIVKLAPYRTYYDIEQPETMYLIRVRDGGELKIFESDGGSWKAEAQRRVSKYLREELEDLIKSEEIVIVG